MRKLFLIAVLSSAALCLLAEETPVSTRPEMGATPAMHSERQKEMLQHREAMQERRMEKREKALERINEHLLKIDEMEKKLAERKSKLLEMKARIEKSPAGGEVEMRDMEMPREPMHRNAAAAPVQK